MEGDLMRTVPESAATPRHALVTGAGRGIGRAVACGLAARGHRVAATARTLTDLEETAAIAAARGGVVVPVVADLADPDACADLPARAAQMLGHPLEILVHNAGMPHSAKVTALELGDWNTVMAVNATAAFLLAKQVAPMMQECGWGRIVNVGSVYSRIGVAYGGAYVASKHAVLGLTRVLALELARFGITANTVIPGWTDTRMVADQAVAVARGQGSTPDDAMRQFLKGTPIGRLIHPEETAALVEYLCSEPAGAVTGQAINIDGGMNQA